MKIFGNKGARSVNDGPSESAARNFRIRTEALGFAVRAHSANN